MKCASFCLSCPTRTDCKAICTPLERYLTHLQAIQGYSDRHRRRKELLWDASKIEDLGSQRVLELRYGKKWADRQRAKKVKYMSGII